MQTEVTKITFSKKENPWDILKFQIFIYCYFNGIRGISDADLSMLALLYLDPDRNLMSFCAEVADRGIFGSVQSARNAVLKAVKNNLLIRTFGKKEQILHINPSIRHSTEENTLLTYNLLALGTPVPPAFKQEPKLKEIKNIVKL